MSKYRNYNSIYMKFKTNLRCQMVGKWIPSMRRDSNWVFWCRKHIPWSEFRLHKCFHLRKFIKVYPYLGTFLSTFYNSIKNLLKNNSPHLLFSSGSSSICFLLCKSFPSPPDFFLWLYNPIFIWKDSRNTFIKTDILTR